MLTEVKARTMAPKLINANWDLVKEFLRSW